MDKEKKGGRPNTGRTDTIHTTCTSEDKEYIKNLGMGNMSLGLKILVDFHKAKSKKKM